MFTYVSNTVLWRQGEKEPNALRESPKLEEETYKSRYSYQRYVANDPDDPPTQVSKTCYHPTYECKSPKFKRLNARESASASPQSSRRISSTLLRFSSPSFMTSPEDSQNASPNLQELSEAEESTREASEGIPEIQFEPLIKPTFTKKDIVSFCTDIKKKTQRDDLPISARFAVRAACRFELPPDIRKLEGIDPMTYLMSYCSVTPMKQEAYKKAYKKICRANLETILSPQYLTTAFYEVFFCPIPESHLTTLKELIRFDESKPLDEKTFISLCGMMERILSTDNKYTYLKDLDKKNDVEIADFSALILKLQGVNLTPEMQNLINYIKNS